MKPPLGDLGVDRFMTRYWQRRPRLMRAALPCVQPPLSRAEVFGLAARDDVESRLVSAFDGRWRLAHGPFGPRSLPPRSRPGWTLLVQGVDGHHPAARRLLDRFRFIADCRLDDLMISWASEGGGVGPHVDSYDVFLLQVEGLRRWRLGPVRDAAMVPGLPLKVLSRFEPTEQHDLAPGDMLYLPPGWGHDGTAIGGPCMTCSIGFRAPSRLELLRHLLADAADEPGGTDQRFTDAGIRATRRPGAIPEALFGTLSGWALDWQPRPAEVRRAIGCFLTEPKASVWFDAPKRPPTETRFDRAARAHGLCLDRRSRVAYRGRWFFINGESCAMPSQGARWLRELADRRLLSPATAARWLEDVDLARQLRSWIGHGWLRFGSDDDA